MTMLSAPGPRCGKPIVLVARPDRRVVLPRFWVGRRQAGRLKAFNKQLRTRSRSSRMPSREPRSSRRSIVVRETRPPISTEFRRVIREVNLGLPFELALNNMVRRVRSEDLELMATAITIQHPVGGNLAEILDSIAYTIRERVRIKGEIKCSPPSSASRATSSPSCRSSLSASCSSQPGVHGADVRPSRVAPGTPGRGHHPVHRRVRDVHGLHVHPQVSWTSRSSRWRASAPDRRGSRRRRAILLIVVGLAGSSPVDPVQARLDQLGSMQAKNLEEMELQQPLIDRTLRPLMGRLSGSVSRVASTSFTQTTEKRLALAGNPGNMRVADWLGIKAVGAIVGAIVGVLLFVFPGVISSLPVPVNFFPSPTGPYSGTPSRSSGSAAASASARRPILLMIPDALDLLTISVRAGLGFDGALGKVVEKLKGPLTEEFRRALAEIRVGKARRDALRDIVPRTEVPALTNFIGAIIQAEQLGVSISKVLQVQSEQLRIERRQRAEEMAAKAPIKMLFPLVGCIFPSLFIVILGPGDHPDHDQPGAATRIGGLRKEACSPNYAGPTAARATWTGRPFSPNVSRPLPRCGRSSWA